MLLTGKERVAVCGMRTEQGSFYTRAMIDSGTSISCGISRDSSIRDLFKEFPFFSSVKEAYAKCPFDILIVYDYPRNVKDRVIEALMAGVPWIIIGTNHVPLLDMVIIRQKLALSKSQILGPSSSGILIPGRGAFGAVSTLNYTKRSGLGVISRSESLIIMLLDAFGVGFSQVLDVGSDPVVGMDTNQALHYLMNDPETKQILVMGVKLSVLADIPYPKPVFCMIVGEDEDREFKYVEKVTSFTYLKKLGRKERTYEKRNTKNN